jgi:hypothetical protein
LFKFLYSVCFWLVVYTTSVQGPLSNKIVSAQLDFTTQPTAESQSRFSFLFFQKQKQKKKKEKKGFYGFADLWRFVCVSDAFRRFEPACTGPSVLKSKRLASGRREREKSNGTNVRHLRNQTGNGTAQGRIGQLSQFNSGFERSKRTEKE